jgi:hypothetical protein
MLIIKIQKFFKKHEWIGRRCGMIIVALFIIGYGLIHIVERRIIYYNYWGGIVFSHFVVGIGILALLVGIYMALKQNNDNKGK